jgi:exosome complex exonuclease DIS3/RRP44
LNHLAKGFRAKRMAAGALTLASPEVRFVLDQATQNPLDVAMYELKETNALVEEFMLLANITVSEVVNIGTQQKASTKCITFETFDGLKCCGIP